MLAQIQNVPPDFLKSLLIACGAFTIFLGTVTGIVFGVLNYLAKLRTSKTTISPDPLTVRRATDFVEFATWEREHNNVLARLHKVEGHYDALQEAIARQGVHIEGKMDKNSEEFRKSLGTVHRRLDGVIPVLYKLAGKMGVIVPNNDGSDA